MPDRLLEGADEVDLLPSPGAAPGVA
jgi:hypothetical protein